MGKMRQLIVSTMVIGVLSVSGQASASKLVDQSGSDDPVGFRSIMSDAKIDKRTRPVAQVCVQGDEDCGADAPGVASAAAETAKTPKDLYNSACMACHASGAAGAPKVGEAAEWGSRIDKGMETLYTNAIKGINMMPPMGTCATCSEDDIKAIVDYMVEASQ